MTFKKNMLTSIVLVTPLIAHLPIMPSQVNAATTINQVSQQSFWTNVNRITFTNAFYTFNSGVSELPVGTPVEIQAVVDYSGDVPPISQSVVTFENVDPRLKIDYADNLQFNGKQAYFSFKVTLLPGEQSVNLFTVKISDALPNDGLHLTPYSQRQTILEQKRVMDPIPTPDPNPTPQPDPMPDPVPTPDPDPAPQPDPSPNPVPTPDPDPVPQPDPSPDPVPTPDSNPAPQPDPSPDPVPTPDSNPAPQTDPSPDPVPTPDPNPAPRDTGKNQLDLTASTNLQKLLPDTATTNSTFKQQFNSQLNTKLSQPANLSTLKGNQQLPQTGENTHEGWLISLVGIMLVATASNWLPRKR